MFVMFRTMFVMCARNTICVILVKYHAKVCYVKFTFVMCGICISGKTKTHYALSVISGKSKTHYVVFSVSSTDALKVLMIKFYFFIANHRDTRTLKSRNSRYIIANIATSKIHMKT